MNTNKKDVEIIIAQQTEDHFQEFWRLAKEFNRYYDQLGIGEQYGRIPADDQPEETYRQEFNEHFENKDSVLAFAKDGNKYIGYTAGCIQKLSKDYLEEKIGFGESLFVTESYRGQGVGELLQDFRFNWFKNKGARFCQITVKAKNIDTVNKFKGQGFEIEEYKMWKAIL